MADTDPKPSETASQPPLKNEQPTATPPEEKKPDDVKIEELRKKAEQAEMRVNQLTKELDAEKKAKAESKQKELEKNQEYKILYEQKDAELEEIKRDQEAAEQQKTVAETTQKTLADYPDEVKAIAEDTGLSLKDATDEAVTEFKTKLDKIQTRLGVAKVTPNNPGVPSSKKDYTGEELRQILADPVRRDAYYRAKGGTTAMMMNPAS